MPYSTKRKAKTQDFQLNSVRRMSVHHFMMINQSSAEFTPIMQEERKCAPIRFRHKYQIDLWYLEAVVVIANHDVSYI